MTPEEIRKLLGGYASGTLTDAEQQALFAAALEDQGLFDELLREESLREVLSDPAARAQMLAIVEKRPKPWRWWRPAAVLAMAGLAAVAVLVMRPKPQPEPRIIVAETKTVAPAPALPPPPPPRKAVQAIRRPPPAPVAEVATADAAPKVAPAPVASPMARASLSASNLAAPSPRNSFLGTGAPAARFQAVMTAAAERPLAVRYTILRKQGDEFVEVEPDSLTTSDTVALRLTANTSGYLSLGGAEPISLTAMQPYTTAPLAADAREIAVVFSRTPQRSQTDPEAPSVEPSGREVFVSGPVSAATLAFTISLQRK